MVDKFKEILKHIEQQKGEVKFFAILKMDEIVDKWSIILSASWITDEEKERDAIFDFVIEEISKKLSKEEIGTIARLSLYNTDNYLVGLLVNRCGDVLEDNVKKLTSEAINGNQIHEAVIFRARS